MSRTCACCPKPIENRRGDAVFCSDACKQAAWRAREAARQAARRAAVQAAVATRDLEAMLRELAAAAGKGSAWIRAGTRMRSITGDELLALADLAAARRMRAVTETDQEGRGGW